jgi:hypothetical protein
MNCKSYAAAALVALLVNSGGILNTAFAGYEKIYFAPKLIEIYQVGVYCYVGNFDGSQAKQITVNLGYTTDLTIRGLTSYCEIRNLDLSTTCEEDVLGYENVISDTGTCHIRLNSDEENERANVFALCNNSRNTVVNMIYELCGILMEVQ